ncbi:alpha/beta hydrolase [Aspergillus homomorphus CBS 101889]|uniref:Alpha/beta-hydrolase n=1 Tax=Aspergillus homomorphus (strain CBS 101889) TaxID=1450537 RepID=A0A395I1T3_ASPHC|nr:alpha/beta-hydrolase [Aspergillus homomorphus CBS 101889]RAL14152.1 alpha/beta-hydrolase [Aspergillus homomorphus CBS 101889]
MIPKTASRTTLDPEVKDFLTSNPNLRLSGRDLFDERRHHVESFSLRALPEAKQPPILHVEHTAIPNGPHGTIPLRILYPSRPFSTPSSTTSQDPNHPAPQTPALIYFHGGGYTVGSADDFEPGCRMLSEQAGIQIYLVEYRLAPEWRYPTQLDEYDCVLEWLRGEGGRARHVDPDRIFGGGDSAGGNMTAAMSLRRLDRDQRGLDGLFLLYPEARLPFDTPAAAENNSGLYLECNGIFNFAANYLPDGVPPGSRYISPGMQPVDSLKGLPPTRVYTCGFDPLRDVGVEFASKLEEAGNAVAWRHNETLCHGFLQMAPWSEAAMAALKQVAGDVRDLAEGGEKR